MNHSRHSLHRDLLARFVMPASVQHSYGWVTIPPYTGGDNARLADHYTAAGWVTVRPPLTGSTSSKGETESHARFG
jgi:hypothetical protein